MEFAGPYAAFAGGRSMALAGLVLLALSGGPGLAQVLPPSAAPTGVQIDPGRVFGDDAEFLGGLDVLAGFGFNITAALQTEWSNNFARGDEDEPLRNGLESRSDWRFSPSVSVSAGRPIGRQQIFANASLGRDFYARNTLLDKNRIAIDGGVNWTLGTRCTGRVQGGWRKRGTQLATFEEVVPSTTERTTFFASAACRTAGGLAPSISYDRYNVKNRTDEDAPEGVQDRSFSDVEAQGVNGSLGYSLGSRGQVGVQGNWRRFEYPNQFLDTGETNGSTITGATFFANYRVGTSITANGSLGFSKVSPESSLGEDFSGTVWNIGLNYSGPRIGASISTGRNVNGSTGGSGNYRISRFLSANVSYRASERLSAAAGYAHGNSDNRGVSEIPDTEIISNSKSNRFFVGADYRFNRILSFGVDLNHQRRSSEPSEFSYSATSILFSARASF
jgi:hypothetical protein